jgi:hypothetical protein
MHQVNGSSNSTANSLPLTAAVIKQHNELTAGSSSNGPSGLAPLAPPSAGDEAELGQQLKAATHQLLQLLSKQAGLPAARRLLELLDSVPPWRAADVVAAALGRNYGVSSRSSGSSGNLDLGRCGSSFSRH